MVLLSSVVAAKHLFIELYGRTGNTGRQHRISSAVTRPPAHAVKSHYQCAERIIANKTS